MDDTSFPTGADLPAYRMPPLDEVAAGVQFQPIPFRLADVGAFYSLLKSEYPVTVDVPALPPVFEIFGPLPFPFPPAIAAGAPWRSWFLSAHDDYVIQLQPDRLLANWRARAGQPPYPRYAEVRRRFVDAADMLAQLLEKLELPAMQPNQCELGYFNKIPVPQNSEFSNLGVILRGLDFSRNAPEFADAQFRTTRILLNEQQEPIARLTVDCSPTLNDTNVKLWALNITVRGRPASPSMSASLDLLDRAHVEIVQCFDKITTEAMHEFWGKVT